MKRTCKMCGNIMNYKDSDDFLNKGYSRVQFGNKKSHWFCEKHTTKQKVKFIEHLITKEKKGDE